MGVAANRSTPLLSIYWRAHAHTLRRWSVCYWHIHNPYIKFRCIDSGKTPANQHLDIDISSSLKSPPGETSSAVMDAGNGFPAAKYAGAPHDTTIMNQIMLRFRPIAPKPVAGGSSDGSTPENNNTELVTKRRTKRKYVRVKKSSKCKSNKEDEANKDGSSLYEDKGAVLTLQLMPESSSGVKNSLENSGSRPFWMNFQKSENSEIFPVGSDQIDRTVEMQKKRVVESWVLVDRMTNALVEGDALGSTDMEKMKNLEADTCPGLISDGLDRVQWVNLAYRRMVDPLEGSGNSPKLVTWLVVKEKILLPNSSAFACTVRILYTKNSQTMPCDVWKMEFGGFAWRLDAKAALRLGR